jgi:phosphopantetheine--protein transferase-like protein
MIVIYHMDVRNVWDSRSEFDEAVSFLPSVCHEKIARIKVAEDAKLALASQLLQRYVVIKHLKPDLRIKDVEIRSIGTGRPYAPGFESKIDFNVSHQAGEVVIAVRIDGLPIGVDITDCTLGDDWINDVAPGVLSKRELEYCHTEGSSFAKTFLVHWACKEAYLKATGIGLGDTNLSHIEILPTPGAELGVVLDGDSADQWRVEQFGLPSRPDLIGALATPCTNQPIDMQEVVYQDIRRMV